MGNSYMRPRYNGYLYFQDQAGEPLQQCILHNGDVKKALYEMNLIYQNSIKNVPSNFIA
jgi:multiple sugar transport system substrate-binding protein